jgi:FHS family Na+ dependent glucose MFS transporter 1
MKQPARLIYLGFYAFASMGFNASVVGPALPTFASQTGSSLEQVGFLFTTFALGYVTSVLIMGSIHTRFGMRSMLVIAAACLVASFGLLLAGRSLVAILAAGYLLGLGQSGTQVGYNATIGLLAGKQAARALSRMSGFFGVGALLSPAVVALGFSLHGSATLALALALAMIVPLLVAALAYREPARAASAAAPAAAAPRERHTVRALLRQPALWVLGATASIYIGAEVAFSGWAAVFAQRQAGVDIATASLVVSVFFAAFTIGRYITDVAMRRVRALVIVPAAIAMTAAGLALMIGAQGSFAATAAGSLVVGFAMAPIYPILISYGVRLFPRQATLAISALTSMAAIVTLGVPSAIGVVMTNQGPAAAWTWLLGIVALLMGAWLVLRRFVLELG